MFLEKIMYQVLYPEIWFPDDNLRTPQPIDLKFPGMISPGMRKIAIDFGGGISQCEATVH